MPHAQAQHHTWVWVCLFPAHWCPAASTPMPQEPPLPCCPGRLGVPRRYLGDGGFIWQVLEHWSVVVTVVNDDGEFSGDLPGVREGMGWVQEMAPSTLSGSKASSITHPWAKPTSALSPTSLVNSSTETLLLSPSPAVAPSPCPSTHCIVYPIRHFDGDGELGLDLEDTRQDMVRARKSSVLGQLSPNTLPPTTPGGMLLPDSSSPWSWSLRPANDPQELPGAALPQDSRLCLHPFHPRPHSSVSALTSRSKEFFSVATPVWALTEK